MHLAGQIAWGDAPTWAGFVAAIIAAGFAAASFIKLKQQVDEQSSFIAEQRAFMAEQSATLALERQALQAAAGDRRTAQSRLVDMRSLVSRSNRVVTVTNRSNGTITNVQVKFGPYVASQIWETNSAESVVSTAPLLNPVPVVGAMRGAQFTLNGHTEATLVNNPPVLTFTDEGGVRWSVDDQGVYTELGSGT
ncbi:hypothetical protein [Kitasatospora sp. NPDC005748]|uniref:hypothetical protein n=1 Tax=Kitasatospora sp. NPDC005748 TaxID=3157063 RepID=UPI00340526AA